MVVVDVKGELANSTAKHRAQAMGHAVWTCNGFVPVW
jgi:type IV secretory pathway TraG/TraD family ATPase VirD4